MVSLGIYGKYSETTIGVDLGLLDAVDDSIVLNEMKKICDNPSTEIALNFLNVSKSGLKKSNLSKEDIVYFLKRVVYFYQTNSVVANESTCKDLLSNLVEAVSQNNQFYETLKKYSIDKKDYPPKAIAVLKDLKEVYLYLIV